MQLMSFSANQPIVLFGQNYTVQKLNDNNTMTLCSEEGGTREYEISTLIKHYIAGSLKARNTRFVRSNVTNEFRRVRRPLISDISATARKSGEVCSQYLRAIETSGLPLKSGPALDEVLTEVSRRVGKTNNPSISTLKRWRNRAYRNAGDHMALIPHFDRRGGRGKSRMPKDTQHEMHAVIDNVYLTTEVKSLRIAHEELVRRLVEASEALGKSAAGCLPSYSTFRRMVLARNQYEVTASRHGANAAQRIFRSTGRSTEIFSFNECWEMDHTVLDLIVVDKVRKLELGRPRITAAIEYTTGALVGFDIDFTGTSAQAVLNCLKHSITPKAYLRERFPDVRGDWPCHGVPMVLKVDNGLEFHSKSVIDACYELGIELQFCPVAQAWYKGRVERFFRTLNEGLLNTLPGATGIDLKRRKDLEDSNFPVIDLEYLSQILHIWIVDVYMTSQRRGAI